MRPIFRVLQLLEFVYTLTSDLLIQPIKSNVEHKFQPRNGYYTMYHHAYASWLAYGVSLVAIAAIRSSATPSSSSNRRAIAPVTGKMGLELPLSSTSGR